MDRGMVNLGRFADTVSLEFTIIAGIRKSADLKRNIDQVPRDEIYCKRRSRFVQYHRLLEGNCIQLRRDDRRFQP